MDISSLAVLNFVTIILIIYIVFTIIIDLKNINEYIDSNENQLKNLVGDINYNNSIISGGSENTGGNTEGNSE